MIKALLITLFVYLMLSSLVYVFQRTIQYRPNQLYPGTPKDNGVAEMKQIDVTTEDGFNLYAWYAAPKNHDGKIFVIYHGNAGNLAKRVDKAKALIGMGYGVYLCEYRGYGGNKGKPDEAGFYNDGRSAIKWLIANGYKKSQFVIYGESIGSGVATQMALEYKTDYLVYEGGFDNVVNAAKQRYFLLPVNWLLKDRYDNLEKIKDVKSSILFLHGSGDRVVNISLAKRLFDAATSKKKFVEINGGGHVNLFDFGAAKIIKDWLENK